MIGSRVVDQTATDVATTVLAAGTVALLVVLRLLLRFLHGRARFVMITTTVVLVICAGFYILGAGTSGR